MMMMMVVVVQRLRRSVPSSLSRCRSAGGAWTTTTSATGMPSLDTEPLVLSRRFHLVTGGDGQRGAAAAGGRVSRQHLLTSDYESSDSPSSSEHGEHVVQRLSTSSSAERLRDVVPDTAVDVDRDVSPSPSPPPSFHIELSRDQVLQCWCSETRLLYCPILLLVSGSWFILRQRRFHQLFMSSAVSCTSSHPILIFLRSLLMTPSSIQF